MQITACSVGPILVTDLMAPAAVMPVSRKPSNYDEISMQQSLLFSDSLKQPSILNCPTPMMTKSRCSVTYMVNNLSDEQVEEVSGTKIRVSSIEQRLRTCREYIDREGISQQSLVINTPMYHKRYILPVGEAMHGANRTKSKYLGCSLDDEDDWHQLRNGSCSIYPFIIPFTCWTRYISNLILLVTTPLSCPSNNSRNTDIFGSGNPDSFSQKRTFSVTVSTASTAIFDLFLYRHDTEERTREANGITASIPTFTFGVYEQASIAE
ncbi:hypothetical protein F3Y22_tig00113721pilonHSYRG00010 [Hibiscus syriacus]|uniref:Uncharacterized protein n=1 Tax=Hibiscus syriacus TaxID=106335 RepID=A0A6A2X4J2_HIBSY|nr:hypothetical protein F3Y22_tig00113721pilonHSYRG00010 [Hibiscus syriacus]